MSNTYIPDDTYVSGETYIQEDSSSFSYSGDTYIPDTQIPEDSSSSSWTKKDCIPYECTVFCKLAEGADAGCKNCNNRSIPVQVCVPISVPPENREEEAKKLAANHSYAKSYCTSGGGLIGKICCIVNENNIEAKENTSIPS